MNFLATLPGMKRIFGVPKPKRKSKPTKKVKSFANKSMKPSGPLSNEEKKKVDKYLNNKLKLLKSKKRVLPLPPKEYNVKPGIGRKLPPRPNVKVNKNQKPQKLTRKAVRNRRQRAQNTANKIRKNKAEKRSKKVGKRIVYNEKNGKWMLVN
jgi:hypothetical protein